MDEETLLVLLDEEAFIANELKQLKSRESELRKRICLHLLGEKPYGTYTDNIGPYEVKYSRGASYSLDQKLIKDMLEDDKLTQEEIDCIRVKYELALTKYKAMEETTILDDAITVKDLMPTLSIEPR